MKLYHGSNIPINNPQLIPNKRALDFGAGFYLTSSLEQATKWSLLTVKRRRNGVAAVSIFEVDEKKLATLSVLHFPHANIDWLKFISANRNNQIFPNNWDIIIGPVANDNTMPVINLYLKGSYDEAEALKRLLPQKLKDQYVFKTKTALEILNFSGVITP